MKLDQHSYRQGLRTQSSVQLSEVGKVFGYSTISSHDLSWYHDGTVRVPIHRSYIQFTGTFSNL